MVNLWCFTNSNNLVPVPSAESSSTLAFSLPPKVVALLKTRRSSSMWILRSAACATGRSRWTIQYRANKTKLVDADGKKQQEKKQYKTWTGLCFFLFFNGWTRLSHWWQIQLCWQKFCFKTVSDALSCGFLLESLGLPVLQRTFHPSVAPIVNNRAVYIVDP